MTPFYTALLDMNSRIHTANLLVVRQSKTISKQPHLVTKLTEVFYDFLYFTLNSKR